METGPILDCRETVMGPSPWRRTACESVGERWCDGAGGLLTLGFGSYRCLHACWRGMETGPIFDCRETVMGPCPWRRTACESVGERWWNGAGGLLTLCFGSYRCLHACWRGMVTGPIFDCRETVMGSCTATRARGGAQPARVSGSDGATAQAVC
jgi:hypothetical protein